MSTTPVHTKTVLVLYDKVPFILIENVPWHLAIGGDMSILDWYAKNYAITRENLTCRVLDSVKYDVPHDVFDGLAKVATPG